MRSKCLPPRAVFAAATAKTARPPHAAMRRAVSLSARLSGLALVTALAACAAQPPVEEPTARASTAAIDLPLADPSVGAAPSAPLPAGLPSNAALARDFMELSFSLESGRPLGRFTRFEGPVSVTLAGPVPAIAPTELARLVARFNREAGIPVTTQPGQANTITVQFVPKRQMNAEVPNAACFVVPNVTGWDDYRANRRSPRSDWTQVAMRTSATVFVPAEATPQEVRDCLHEEISQALGPLNDLYRLPDSVWNDDNFQTTLTHYDMTQLRATYAPELHSGMSAPEVQAQLPTIYARINPAGGAVGPLREDPTPRAYVSAIEQALGRGRIRRGARPRR